MYYDRCSIPEDGNALAAYRSALVNGFEKEPLQQLCCQIEKSIEARINFGQSLEGAVDAMISLARQEGWLGALLVLALRHRAGNRTLVSAFAKPLSIEPLINLAEMLWKLSYVSQRCTKVALTIAIEKLPDTAFQLRPNIAFPDGPAFWIDRLVWLDQLPSIDGYEPPLVQVIAHMVSSSDLEGAAPQQLQEWLDGVRREFGFAAVPLKGRENYNVVVEVVQCGSTWFAAASKVDANGPSLLLVHYPSEPAHEQGVECELARVVEDCLCKLTGGLSDTFPCKEVPERSQLPEGFEFLLPSKWLGLAVDQLKFGAEQGQAPLCLGATWPVIVRPHAWCRPSKGRLLGLQQRFERKRRKVRDGKCRVDVVATPGLWDGESLMDAENDDALAGFVLVFDDLSVVDQLLQTHVLAVVWVRGCGADSLDVDSQQYLKSLIEDIRRAPERVAEARRTIDSSRKKYRDKLSLIWHVDPVALPDQLLLVPTVQQ